MKEKSILKYTILAIIILVSLITFLLNKKIVDYKKELSKCENTNNSEKNENDINNDKNNGEEYECTLVETLKIVNMLDGYESDAPEIFYVVADTFQSHAPNTYAIPVEYKDKLQLNKFYEFVYTFNSSEIVTDKRDIYRYFIDTLINEESDIPVKFTVTETNKEGLEHINEISCSN